MDGYDGTATNGRKGVAYDWRSVLRATEFDSPDTELDSWITDEAIARFIDGAVAR